MIKLNSMLEIIDKYENYIIDQWGVMHDGKDGYKSCGRASGEKRKKYPACRPTPGACKERGKGKSWGKKAKRRSKKK